MPHARPSSSHGAGFQPAPSPEASKRPFARPASQPWCGLSARAVARGQQASIRAPVSQPWCGLSARAVARGQQASIRAPVSQPWCGLSARAVARGQQASIRAPGTPGRGAGFQPAPSQEASKRPFARPAPLAAKRQAPWRGAVIVAQGKRRRRRAPPWVARHIGPCSSASLAPVGAADWGQRGNGTH